MRLSRRRLIWIGLAGLAGLTARGQNTSRASARDLFLVDSKGTGPLALRYSLLQRTKDGSVSEAELDHVFHSGDRFRLRIEVSDSGYLYVVQHGSSGSWNLIFPTPESPGPRLVDRGPAYDIPEDVWFEFDERAGEEKLLIVFSRQSEQDIDKQLHPAVVSRSGGAVPEAALATIRNQARSRDLVLQEVSMAGNGAVRENAIYVADRSGGPDSRLVLDVTLKHQ